MKIDGLSPEELEGVLRANQPKDWPDRREQYPGAPDDPVERREWFARRNEAIQRGLPRPADGVSFGKVPKK